MPSRLVLASTRLTGAPRCFGGSWTVALAVAVAVVPVAIAAGAAAAAAAAALAPAPAPLWHPRGPGARSPAAPILYNVVKPLVTDTIFFVSATTSGTMLPIAVRHRRRTHFEMHCGRPCIVL